MTTNLIYAPWTDEQVTALNAFQHHGRMHPFTCGAVHSSGRSPILVATPAEWICPDPECDYTQDWAHAFMAASAVVAVAAPPTGQTAEVRLELARILHELHLRAEFDATEDVDAVLAVLPPPPDRAAILREEAARIRAHCPDHLDSNSADGAWMACDCDVADDMLRRLADEAQQPEDDAVVPPPALTEVGRLRAQVEVLQQDAERDRGLAKVGARCMREGHQGLIESGRAVIEGWRFALSTALGLGTGAPWEAIHERVKELADAPAVVSAVPPQPEETA